MTATGLASVDGRGSDGSHGRGAALSGPRHDLRHLFQVAVARADHQCRQKVRATILQQVRRGANSEVAIAGRSPRHVNHKPEDSSPSILVQRRAPICRLPPRCGALRPFYLPAAVGLQAAVRVISPEVRDGAKLTSRARTRDPKRTSGVTAAVKDRMGWGAALSLPVRSGLSASDQNLRPVEIRKSKRDLLDSGKQL